MPRTPDSLALRSMTRLLSFFRSRLVLGVSALCIAPALTACPKGDVGAPCNHGRIEPPQSKLVTFPALSCDKLLCVYADETEPPEQICEVGSAGDLSCNEVDPSITRFTCQAVGEGTNGECVLRNQYVLERSMCSKGCATDADCENGGITKQVVVEDNNCNGNFLCVRIQTLGNFCCEKLCVCEDDLGLQVQDIQEACASNSQPGCCIERADGGPPAEACGKP